MDNKKLLINGNLFTTDNKGEVFLKHVNVNEVYEVVPLDRNIVKYHVAQFDNLGDYDKDDKGKNLHWDKNIREVKIKRSRFNLAIGGT